MSFHDHSRLEGTHAPLSASNNAWTNYDRDKLKRVYRARRAAARGTELHETAAVNIKAGIYLDEERNGIIGLYVNDAIRYRMTPEQILYFSDNCYGTADAISFRNGLLRIHDLKTGVGKTSIRQLEIYAALYCLEYDVDPYSIETELRIYQGEGYRAYEGIPEAIEKLMHKIVDSDMTIEEINWELA